MSPLIQGLNYRSACDYLHEELLWSGVFVGRFVLGVHRIQNFAIRIRIQTSTSADNRRKITLSAPQLEKLEWLFITLFCDRTSIWVTISVWH